MTDRNPRQDYVNSYNRDNYTTISIRFDKVNEAHIIRAIKASGKPKEFIKACIQKELSRQGVPMVLSNRKAHDDIAGYPYEVLEFLKHGPVYIVGYCRSLDHARDMLIEYVQRQQHGCGTMRIVCRGVGEIGGGRHPYGAQPDLVK